MKNKFYKSLPNSLAKTRISKLVDAKDKAWDDFREVKALGVGEGDICYDIRLAKAIGYSQALRVMGIVDLESLED